MMKPDAVLKYLRNLEPGNVTIEHGTLLAIDLLIVDGRDTGYYTSTWDKTGPLGQRPVIYSHPGNLLVTVICEEI